MVNKNKAVGSKWEHDSVELLNAKVNGSEFKRVPGSGAMGTSMGEGLLCGDIKGEVEDYPIKFRGEAKTGYGGETQLTVKKEWLDKIIMEARNVFSLPFLIAKFKGARAGVKSFVVMDIDTFATMINTYTDLKKELDSVYKEVAKLKG